MPAKVRNSGHNTSLEEHSYEYIDASPISGVSYDRLKQLDLDGAVHYTDAVRVEVKTGAMNEDQTPKELALFQNYPNPFNLSTTIRYGLPQKSTVRLTVFNTLSQQVATLVQGVQEAGYHTATFDGTGLARGVYLYRIQVGEYTQMQKPLLLK